MNKAKLVYEMTIRGIKQSQMCELLGISRSAFYRKCNGISEFTQGEIQKIVDFLKLDTPVGIFFENKEVISMKPKDIPDVAYEIGCSVLSSSVRHFFSQPGVKEEYEAWMETEEGQRAEHPGGTLGKAKAAK